MKKRFIVLVDFSEYSTNLLKYAHEWSMQINAELLLVHKVDFTIAHRLDKETKARLVKQADSEGVEKLRAFSQSILPDAAHLHYKATTEDLHTLLPELLSEAFEHLLFVGLKGTNLLKKILVGSVAIQIIETANSTVVAMPKEVSHFSPGKLFVAVSDDHPLNILALNNFFDSLGKGIESITFFTMVKPDEEKNGIEKKLSDLSKLFSEKYNSTFAVYEVNNSSEIKKVINNKIEEMLIIQKGSRLLMDQLFRKFLINELVYEGETPLVVLPAK